MQGGGSEEPRIVDFPSVEGLRPVQGLSDEVAAAHSVLVVDDGIQKDYLVIFFMSWVYL